MRIRRNVTNLVWTAIRVSLKPSNTDPRVHSKISISY